MSGNKMDLTDLFVRIIAGSIYGLMLGVPFGIALSTINENFGLISGFLIFSFVFACFFGRVCGLIALFSIITVYAYLLGGKTSGLVFGLESFCFLLIFKVISWMQNRNP